MPVVYISVVVVAVHLFRLRSRLADECINFINMANRKVDN